MSADANAAFLYRTLALTESCILMGAAPVLGNTAIVSEGLAWAQHAVVLPYGGKCALDEMLANAAKVMGTTGRFPALILPGDEALCEEAREFAIVYDFTVQRRRAAVLTKPPKLKPVSGVAIQADAPDELLTEAAASLGEQYYLAENIWLDIAKEGIAEVYSAHVGGKPAGVSFAVRAGIENRLMALFTLPEHRGKGVGRALASHFINRAAQAGLPLTTAVYPGSATFEYYATKLGFTPALSYEIHFPPPGFAPPK